MFLRSSLGRSSPSVRQAVSNQGLSCNTTTTTNRTLGNQSQFLSSSLAYLRPCFGGSDNTDNKSSRDSFFRSVASGIVISSLAFSSWFSSNLSLADGSKDEDELPHSTSLKKPKFLFGDSYRRRIFFNYEKRIRMQSPPEKIFEYFASYKTEAGEVLMTPADLMRAIVPVFPPSESNRVREGFLNGEKGPGELHCPPSKFFMLFDTNSDGLISFAEYIFFVTLLSIPESSFTVAFKMFDLDNNGEIDREEFKKVMALMRTQHRQGSSHRDGRRRLFEAVEPVENGGLIEYFFDTNGQTGLRHDRFVQFLRDLHNEILRLEFTHYDYKSLGTISAKDFALSLVASADISQISRLLDKVDDINNESRLRDIRITFEEFKNFAELRGKLESLSVAIFSYGKVNGVLTKKDFQRAASQVCGISLTDNVIDIIVQVFDADGDGNISSDEFVRVLQRQERSSSHKAEGGAKGGMSCWLKCAKNCSSSKLFV